MANATTTADDHPGKSSLIAMPVSKVNKDWRAAEASEAPGPTYVVKAKTIVEWTSTETPGEFSML